MVAQLNTVDRLVSWVSPAWGVRRARARHALAYYEAAKPDRLRKSRRETGSGNEAVLRAGASLRQIARHLEQNYDLALGVLNTLVINVVGPHGIGIEPQPRNQDGSINDEFAREILGLWKDWCTVPEVTRQHDWSSTCRLLARSWFRDGEAFVQTIAGPMQSLDHGTRIPFSVELLEADFVPMDLQSTQPLIAQGIELNAWGAPVAYHVYKTSPLESGAMVGRGQTKRIPAARMLHVKNVHRIRQLRGVSVFASVLTRFDDLKDYEESERIAAKIAASMAAFIRKGQPELYDAPDGTDAQPSEPRQMKMRPGMIFDDLRPGEDIGTIDTNRPNPNLETYRSGQLRAVAAGTGPTYSSVARTYNGTYSSQRQELVEGYGSYGVLTSEFIGRIIRPIYEQAIATAVASGVLKVPAGIVLETVDDAAYMAPSMPWIDPKKEVEAWAAMEDRVYISAPEIIRKRGGNPIETLEQQSRWLREKGNHDIPTPGATPAAPPVDPEELEARRTENRLRNRLEEARIRSMEVRTAQEEERAEVALALCKAELEAHRSQTELRKALALEACAKTKLADAELGHAQAKIDLMAAERRIAEERASQECIHATAEHRARLTTLEQQEVQAREAEEERRRDAERARADALAIHLEEVKAARARAEAAQIDLAASQEALAELRGER